MLDNSTPFSPLQVLSPAAPNAIRVFGQYGCYFFIRLIRFYLQENTLSAMTPLRLQEAKSDNRLLTDAV